MESLRLSRNLALHTWFGPNVALSSASKREINFVDAFIALQHDMDGFNHPLCFSQKSVAGLVGFLVGWWVLDFIEPIKKYASMRDRGPLRKTSRHYFSSLLR